MKLNKWVKENGKWSEYKCMKFMSDNKEYRDILYKAKNLNDANLQYLINTLEDVLDNRKVK
tara:strand:- start:265 stop:447 length:183 start_codon:yes stop_codon:yes gene_type:complete